MKYLVIIIFITAFSNVFSQDYNLRKIERIIDFAEENDKTSSFKDIIDYYYLNKLSLRTSPAGQLSELPLISYFTAVKIKSYIKKNPNFTMEDLGNDIPLSEDQLYILSICTKPLSIDILQTDDDFSLSIHSVGEFPFQETIGLEQGKYLGSNYGITNKMYIGYSGISFGAVSDKDIAEEKFVDYYGLFLKFPILNTNIVLGNYRLSAGNGNILSTNFSTSKLLSSFNSGGKSQNSITPSLSTSESQVFRGIGVNSQFELSENSLLSISAFASNKDLAATINDSGVVSSIYTSSYFRTQNEIDKRNKLKENIFGAVSSISFNSLDIGAAVYSINYDKSIQSSSSSSIYGEDEILSSAFFTLSFDSLAFSGEASFNKSGEPAFTLFSKYYQGSSEYNLNFRYFSPEFRSPKGTNPGENSFPANEAGITFSYGNKISKKINMMLMLDYFESIKRTYTVFQPVKGIEAEIRFDFKLSRSDDFYSQFVYKNKDEQKTISSNKYIYTENKYRLRLEYNKAYSKVFEQKFRIDFNYIAENNVNSEKTGYLAYTDLEIKPAENFKANIQFAYFSTDDYDAAIWLFNYFTSSYTRIFTLYNEGIRANLYLKYKLSDNLQIGAGYRYYEKFNNSIGSGYDEILSGKDSRLLLSLDFLIK